VHDDHPGAEELGRRLEAYASARLSPRRGASARIRAAVVEEARMRTLEARMERASGGWRGRRRFATLLLAAGLAIAGVAGVAAASTAGGPLYGARLWLETVTLPSNADARAVERIHQIDARMLEVQRATESGDRNAVAAAIAAYRATVDAALTDAGQSADRLAHLRAALGLHVTVLETLAHQVPDAAVDGIDRAIDASEKAVDRIDQTPNDGNPAPGAPGSSAPTDHPGNGRPPKSNGAGTTGNPARTPSPSPDPGPAHTPAH
jgi:hypothetical protein